MKRIFTDQMGRKVEIDFPPRRIVSLVPSLTELLFDFGLDEEIAGITKFCVHPFEKWQAKPKIGGTKKLHLDRIADLHPDLIIGNKEENERSQIEALEKNFSVWMSDVTTLPDALKMIESIGEIVGKKDFSLSLLKKIQASFQDMNTLSPVPAAYLIWRKPYMAAAAGTFINSMLEAAGFQNVFAQKTRYPEITLDELGAVQPEVVMLSSEPYPFSERHVAEIKQHCPAAVVKLVDGELFSWYGSRMLKAAPYFATLHAAIALELNSQV